MVCIKVPIVNKRKILRHFTEILKCQLAGGTTGKVRASPKSADFVLWGPWMFIQNFMAICSIIVEIFQSGTKC